MVSAFSKIIQYEEDGWEEYLSAHLLIDIFRPVIEYYREPDTIKIVVRYIAYAYSIDSDKVILSMDWLKNKEQIFEFVNAKPLRGIYEDLVELKSQAVVDSVQRWIDWQDSATYALLAMYRELSVELRKSAVSDLKKANLETDFDQKKKNADYAFDIRQKIKDLESELIQNNQQLKEAIKEVRNVNKKNTFGVEKFAR